MREKTSARYREKIKYAVMAALLLSACVLTYY